MSALKKARRWLALVRAEQSSVRRPGVQDGNQERAKMQAGGSDVPSVNVTRKLFIEELNSKKRNKKNQRSITICIKGVRSRSYLEAGPGRGRKRADWVNALYYEVSLSFRTVRRAGVKVNGAVLRAMASTLIIEAEEGSAFHRSVIDTKSNLPIEKTIDASWIRRFV